MPADVGPPLRGATGVKLPVPPMVNVAMLTALPQITKSNVPDELIAKATGLFATATGLPEIGVSVPVEASTLSTDTSLPRKSAVNRNLPDGATRAEIGWLPTVKGEPVIGLSAPVLPIEKPTTDVPLDIGTYRYLASGSVANRPGPPFDKVANGEPATAVNAPVVLSIENADTLPSALAWLLT